MYYDEASIAYENGTVTGYGNGKFGAMDKITREQAMIMINSTMKLTKINENFEAGEAVQLLARFNDSEKFPPGQ